MRAFIVATATSIYGTKMHTFYFTSCVDRKRVSSILLDCLRECPHKEEYKINKCAHSCCVVCPSSSSAATATVYYTHHTKGKTYRCTQHIDINNNKKMRREEETKTAWSQQSFCVCVKDTSLFLVWYFGSVDGRPFYSSDYATHSMCSPLCECVCFCCCLPGLHLIPIYVRFLFSFFFFVCLVVGVDKNDLLIVTTK